MTLAALSKRNIAGVMLAGGGYSTQGTQAVIDSIKANAAERFAPAQ